MLHCYILDKIVLHPQDIHLARAAQEAQIKTIAQLEDITMMHSRLAEHYTSQMRNIRDMDVLPHVERMLEENKLHHQLLEVLSKDLQKSEPHIRKEVRKGNIFMEHFCI